MITRLTLPHVPRVMPSSRCFVSLPASIALAILSRSTACLECGLSAVAGQFWTPTGLIPKGLSLARIGRNVSSLPKKLRLYACPPLY